jgi:hypothetical protein
MTKLATASGVVIYEEGFKLHISKTRASWTSTFLFVTGLLALILVANGVLQWFVIKEPNGSAKLGMILLGIGAFFTLIFWRVWAYRKKVAATPFDQLIKIAVIDFQTNNLLNGQQQILSPLQQVFLKRKMQLGSSSPELLLEWSNGSLSLVRGNPFSGGILSIENILLSKGIRKK